jgi:hypothetical protein
LAIPFLIALGELVVVVVLLVAGVVGRVVFRRPWIVDAVDPAGAHHKWPVVGRRASGVARRFIADRVAATGTVPTHEEVLAATTVAWFGGPWSDEHVQPPVFHNTPLPWASRIGPARPPDPSGDVVRSAPSVLDAKPIRE